MPATVEAQTARASVDAITAKLKRCIEPLKQHVTPEGRLDDGDQYAMRVLESRIRLLERMWAFLHGDPKQVERANIELVVHKRDDGTLIQLGEKKHGVGRLDCRACDNEEIEINGVKVQQSASKLCTICQAGIMHCYTQRIDGFEPTPSLTEGVGELNALATRYDALNQSPQASQGEVWVYKVLKCDSCLGESVERVGTETVEPKKERWRSVIL
jgi:hypothetical protein